MNPGDEATLDLRCINTLRTLSIDQLQKASSGHLAIAQVTSATARRASTTAIEEASRVARRLASAANTGNAASKPSGTSRRCIAPTTGLARSQGVKAGDALPPPLASRRHSPAPRPTRWCSASTIDSPTVPDDKSMIKIRTGQAPEMLTIAQSHEGFNGRFDDPASAAQGPAIARLEAIGWQAMNHERRPLGLKAPQKRWSDSAARRGCC